MKFLKKIHFFPLYIFEPEFLAFRILVNLLKNAFHNYRRMIAGLLSLSPKTKNRPTFLEFSTQVMQAKKYFCKTVNVRNDWLERLKKLEERA